MRPISTAICIIFFIILLNGIPVYAENGLLLEASDPANDDFGPGTYHYPSDEAFQQEGLFDITYFSVSSFNDKYRFVFCFSNITDPWGSKYGFSLPLIEVYIGSKGAEKKDLYRDGANVKLNPNYPWSKMLKISGWWVRAYSEDTRDEETNLWDTENNPADIEDAEVDIKGNNLFVTIDQDVLGDLKGKYMYVLIGSYDPFGPDNFRAVRKEDTSWYFMDTGRNKLDYAPRVLDIILPEGLDQVKVLSDYKDGYPVIDPVKMKEDTNPYIYLPYILAVIAITALVLFVMNKKPFISNTNNKLN